jgi:hypothetical protein
VGPRADLDDIEKRKFLTLLTLKLRPLASRYTDYAIPAPRMRGRERNYEEQEDNASIFTKTKFCFC